MAQRYVRVKTADGPIHYGLLQLNRTVMLLDAPPWLGGQSLDRLLEPDQYTLLAPCAPSKIVAVGKNYADHAAEMGGEVPPEPLLFLKPPTAVIAHEQAIVYPPQSHRVDYEGELALIIGERLKNADEATALDAIWGYTIANDVTARDLQQQESQWTRAKGFDGFCPLGPWIVRELGAETQIQTFINQENSPRQCASITEMVFAPAILVAYISRVMTLMPGDVVLTGTPQGIGPMEVGDRVRVEITGIGHLENPLIAPE